MCHFYYTLAGWSNVANYETLDWTALEIVFRQRKMAAKDLEDSEAVLSCLIRSSARSSNPYKTNWDNFSLKIKISKLDVTFMLVHFIRVQAIFVPLKISESDISDRSSSRNGRGPRMVEDPKIGTSHWVRTTLQNLFALKQIGTRSVHDLKFLGKNPMPTNWTLARNHKNYQIYQIQQNPVFTFRIHFPRIHFEINARGYG